MRRASSPGFHLVIASWVTIALGAIASTAAGQVRDTPPPSPPLQQGTIEPGGRRVIGGIGGSSADPRDPRAVPRTGTASISGRIVDGVTGRAIARARVMLMGNTTKGPILSDDLGGFSFTALPSGSYMLLSDRSSYLQTRHPDQGRSMRNRASQISLKDGQQLDDVTVSMYRGGVIAGRVLDAYGDPVESAFVTTLVIPKGGRPQQRSGVMTNDLGEFRVTRLPPGRYVVRVRPQNSYQLEMGPNQRPEKPLPQSLPVFFPGALALDQAQPIVVNRGETVTGVDITLAEGLPTLVSGMVVSADGRPLTGGSVNYRSAALPEFGGADGGAGIRPDGTFRFQIPPGEYTFEARVQPRSPGVVPNGDTELFGSVRASIAGESIEGLIIPIGGGATASGRIVFEGTTPPPPPPAVNPAQIPMFNPTGPECRPGTATIESDWTFKAERISGTCSAQPGVTFGRWTLKAVMVGGQNLVDRAVTFEPGQHYGNLRIVVTDKRPTVEMVVTDESGQPTRDYVVLMFPTDKEKWTQAGRYLRTYVPPVVRQDGMSASRGQLPTGAPPMPPRAPDTVARMFGLMLAEYYAIAIDDIDPEDALDPDVLEKLAAAAVRVQVTDAPVELPLRRVPLASLVR